ncbi:MAG: hypothetical protein Q8Q37_02925 [bacterium]|nr:hypothetical protein [bacterium]
MANNLDNFGPEKLEVGWPWRLLSFSIILFVALAAGYLGLRFGYGSYLHSQIEDKDAEIAELARTIPEVEQQNLLRFYGQLGNLQNVLNKHVIISKVLPLLERITNQRVYYSGFDLDVAKRTVIVDGVAQSYSVLSQQLQSFKETSELESFYLNQTDARGSLVNFKVGLVLNPTVFK